jgi:hypothetical protein
MSLYPKICNWEQNIAEPSISVLLFLHFFGQNRQKRTEMGQKMFPLKIHST